MGKECAYCGKDNSTGKWRFCSKCNNFFCENCIGINDCNDGRDIREYYCPNCIEHCFTCGNVINGKNRLEIKFRKEDYEKTVIICYNEDEFAEESCFRHSFYDSDKMIINNVLLDHERKLLKIMN